MLDQKRIGDTIMTTLTFTIGIIGGSGSLGSAIATALLAQTVVAPADLWISNTSGTATPEQAKSGITVTNDNQALANACDVILFCAPPARFDGITADAPEKLILSVMAGANLEQLALKTRSKRIIRAMSSPAAANGSAYSPWIASPDATPADKALTTQIFEACGKTDEIFDEAQIDHFTAMTGPVPGFVAYFAQCMVDHATAQGIAPDVADRAIRQLFLASALTLNDDPTTPADQVRDMVDYAGTTAAGLTNMMASPLSHAISEGLLVAAAKARTI